MLLYYKPGACSLASRIVLIELGLPFDDERVDTASGMTATGADYKAINPRGYVPALRLGSGTVLTENPAILQYLADQVPASGLAPPAGTLQRVRLQEWLNFIASELHKAFAPWFSGRKLEGDAERQALAQLGRRISDVERALGDGRGFLCGDTFTVADAYLAVVLGWAGFIGLDLSRWPASAGYLARLRQRPAVREAMVAEGLVAEEALQ